jgi:hypothetical protein
MEKTVLQRCFASFITIYRRQHKLPGTAPVKVGGDQYIQRLVLYMRMYFFF